MARAAWRSTWRDEDRPASMLALATHWGVTPTWLDSGHLGAYALRASSLRAVMLDTIDAADTPRTEGSGPQLAVK
jgi:hypothetical protein